MTDKEKLIRNIDSALKFAKDFDPEYESELKNAALVGCYSATLKIIAEYCGLDYKQNDFSKTMTTTSILNIELKDLLSEIDVIEYDTYREYISESVIETQVNAYSLLFKVRVKSTNMDEWVKYRGEGWIKEVYDLEMIYTDDDDHEVILTPTQHSYACKELEGKILITG